MGKKEIEEAGFKMKLVMIPGEDGELQEVYIPDIKINNPQEMFDAKQMAFDTASAYMLTGRKDGVKMLETMITLLKSVETEYNVKRDEEFQEYKKTNVELRELLEELLSETKALKDRLKMYEDVRGIDEREKAEEGEEREKARLEEFDIYCEEMERYNSIPRRVIETYGRYYPYDEVGVDGLAGCFRDMKTGSITGYWTKDERVRQI